MRDRLITAERWRLSSINFLPNKQVARQCHVHDFARQEAGWTLHLKLDTALDDQVDNPMEFTSRGIDLQ